MEWKERARVAVGSRRGRWALAAGTSLLLLAGWVRCGPLPEGFLDPSPHGSVRVLDRKGRLLYEALSEKESRSTWLAPDALPPLLVQATMAAEDHRFHLHPGLDPVALARAAWVDLRAGRLREGGSTLTQQVVKRLLARRRTVAGKLVEMLYALRLEHRLSKRDILALYLNLAPYGNQYAGAQEAARGYFGCPAANLTPAQAAFLAGLPQRPSALDPYRNLAGAVARQKEVLRRMRRLGYLDGESYAGASRERLVLVKAPKPLQAPHFVQEVLSEIGAAGRGEVRTTLDLDLQREVEGVLAAHAADMSRHGAHNAAVAVLDNATGEWLAWEGSGDYYDAAHGGAIDGVTTPRQPGSALKPFTYALAFDRGFTPASVLPDIPSHFATAEAGILYSPRNYDGAFRGPMRARSALAGSENVPAVWLLSQVGVAPLLDLLRTVGFGTLDRTADYYGYGLTLGDPEVRLADLVGAYAALARGGVYLAPTMILPWSNGPERVNESTSQRANGPTSQRANGPSSQRAKEGENPGIQGIVRESTPGSRRVLSERAAFWATDILSDNGARAFAFGRGGSLEFPFPVAAKTGTSQAYRDNWTVGYTREVTVGVWVGNFDGAPMKNSSGVTGAGPIFHDVVLAVVRGTLGRLPGPSDPPVAEPVQGLVQVSLCGLSGQKASEACPSRVTEWLPGEALPPVCRWHLKEKGRVETVWPAEYRAWAARRNPAERRESPAGSAGDDRSFGIESPPDGATYWIDPTLRSEFQAIEFRVAGLRPGARVAWTLDGTPLSGARADGSVRWSLSPGDHRLDASDGRGRTAEVRFTVH